MTKLYKKLEEIQKGNIYIPGKDLSAAGIVNDSYGEIIDEDYLYCIVKDILVRLVPIDSDKLAIKGLLESIYK